MTMDRSLPLQILDILEENARITPGEIALMLGEDEQTVKDVIARLEEEKVIIKYVAVVNREAVEDSGKVEALIEVKVTPQRDYGYDDLARRIYNFPEVKSVYLMAGSYDLAVRIESADMKSISHFVFEKLAVLDGVNSTATLFIMRRYKENGVVLVQEEDAHRLVVSP